MTREDAERLVADEWLDISSRGREYAVRLEPSRTEVYGWGWVVYFGPARRHDWVPGRPRFERYACTHNGRTYPIGTKGLGWALKRLDTLDSLDQLPTAERAARYEQLTTVLNAPPFRPWDDALDYLVATFPEVVSGERAVLRVTRDAGTSGGLGGWVMYDTTDSVGDIDSSVRTVVAAAKDILLARDPSLREVTDLPVGWEAVREASCQAWLRRCSDANTQRHVGAEQDAAPDPAHTSDF